MESKAERKRRGGLEFVPLPAGHSEADFQVPPGKMHPGQQSMCAELLETVKPDGRRKGRS